MTRIRDLRDLRAYRSAHVAAMRVFEVSKAFPDDERFGLTAQIRRSSRSVGANVAEAWRKRRYPAAFVAKLSDAEAEAAETRAHLDTAMGCGYIDDAIHRSLDQTYDRVLGLIVRMVQNPQHWTPGRARGRTAGTARFSPPSPSPKEAATDALWRPGPGGCPRASPTSHGGCPRTRGRHGKETPDEADER